MRPEVWDIIIRPMLMTTKGGALFIGTPEGKNHFYDLWLSAQEKDRWASFHFTSRDNPLIDQEEIEGLAGENMSKAAIRQEIEASFEAAGGGHFSESEVKYAQCSSEPGVIYMAVDPAGFGTSGDLIESELKRRDETAIAIVEVSGKGWFVHDIVAGRWGIRETALRILREAQTYQPACVGIEKGALFNAIFPYLQDEMRRLNVYPVIEGVTHGGKKKADRIMWALKGRFEKGRITFKEDPTWNQAFINQMLDFPNPMAHDDMLDALAYIDQVATTNYNIDVDQDSFVPLDAVIGI
jgi:predicted phage terminase large subunit-like protein